MATQVIVDGTWSLEDQCNALNFYLQQQGAKVTDYQRDTAASAPQNIATIGELPLGTGVPVLMLVEVPTGKTIADVQPLNTALIFDRVIAVSSIATRVAGFY